MGPEEPARLTVWIAGRVQGVGFRWWVRARALELGLTGSAENLEDLRVKVVAEGPSARCQELLDLLSGPGTPGRVTRGDTPLGRAAWRTIGIYRAMTKRSHSVLMVRPMVGTPPGYTPDDLRFRST